MEIHFKDILAYTENGTYTRLVIEALCVLERTGNNIKSIYWGLAK